MKKKLFGISSLAPSKAKRTANVRAYCALLLLSFCVFAIYAGVTSMLFAPNKVDIFKKDLTQVATYFRPIDRAVSEKLLTLNEIVQSYLQWENILVTKTQEIENLWRYITDNRRYLSDLWFKNYDGVMDTIADAYEHREEIYTLLWKTQPRNYILLLQNGNEKRPNGGFFGSFAFLTFEWGHITQMQIVDSYLPDYIAPNARLQLPYRFIDIFWDSPVGFVAGNKFGFTDMDGENIKTLYERMFNQEYNLHNVNQMFNPEVREVLHNKYIKGVIFLDSTLLELLLPGFTQHARERQFINAAIDLIRGEVRSNKKEIYTQQVMQYLDQHKINLVRNTVNMRESVLEQRKINIYISNTTTGFQNFLITHGLHTIYSPDNIYTRDINTANNKSDAFITKEVRLLSEQGDLLFRTHNDIIPIHHLENGRYTLQIAYDFNVPAYYLKFIQNLEEKYKVKLTPREEDILVLGPVQHENKPVPRRRENRGILYFSPHVEISDMRGNITMKSYFTTDFSKGALYRVSTNQNNSTMQVVIDFALNK